MFLIENGILKEYKGSGGDVIVPEGVKRIGHSAFQDCTALTGIALPEGVERIETRAFSGCTALRTVILPEGLREIWRSAFSGCTALASMDLPESLADIDDWAFYGCRGLTRIALPEGVTAVPFGCFGDCERLTTVRLPDGLTEIAMRAFAGCVSLRDLRVPPELERVGYKAFDGCRGLADEKGFLIIRGELHEYFGPREAAEIPEGVTRIARDAFPPGSTPLWVRVPSSVQHVDPEAFPEGDALVLLVRRWSADLTRAVADCRVLAVVTEEPALVPEKYRRALRIGRAFAPDSSPDTPEAREDLAWLARYSANLRRDAFELPELLRFLCSRKLIRPGSVDAYLEEARAQNNPELISLLLSYQSELGMASMEKAREQKQRREDAALEARAARAARDLKEGVKGLTFAVVGPKELIGSNTPLWRTLKRLLKARGARLSPVVTPSVDYLVTVDAAADPVKREKAVELGVSLLPWSEFCALIGLQGKK